MSGDGAAAQRPIEVEAAGAVLTDETGRICVVHRPKYDDWSLPKGKLETGETHLAAAHREILEETGFVGRFERWIGDVTYEDRRGRHKRVRYAEMTVQSGDFEPNREVDSLEWLEIGDAFDRLSYATDVQLVERREAQRGG